MPEQQNNPAPAAESKVKKSEITPEMKRKLAIRTACFKAMREIMEENMEEITKRARKTLLGAGIPFNDVELKNSANGEKPQP